MTRKVAIITGASRGIGLSFAHALLGAGYYLTVTGARDQTQLATVANDLAETHGSDRVLSVLADAGNSADAQRTVTETVAYFGRLDILINNAGRGPREISDEYHNKPVKFWDTPADSWSEIVNTNVNGPFLMARAAAPYMIARGWGRIVNISTSRVTMVRKGFAPYGPTKAALDAMTRVFAQDLEGTGVTTNILLPGGATDTDFIPGNRSGVYLDLLPVDVMNKTLVWMLSEGADGISAGRFVGANWDRTNPAACREDTGAPPLIL
jgi:NAD(P)-dependent dehydrogenase (short-subunit alcohol dehydrogenase family)